LPAELATGEHESLAIESDARAGQPRTVRISADKEEQVVDRSLHLREVTRTPANRFEEPILAK